MTRLQKLQIRLSESRSKINELASKAERTDEENNKLAGLRTAHAQIEADYRTALEAAPQPQEVDNEQRELDRLTSRASIGNVLQATMDQRSTEGPEAELQQHFGLAGNQIPIEMLREERAVTSAPTDVGQQQHPIIPPIFADGVSSFLGIGMPTVGVGEQTYTVLTSRATVGTPAKGAAQDESTGAFSAVVLSPKRAQASFFWSIEDEAQLRGMEAALRANLRSALSSKFDGLLLNDTDEGLLAGGLTAPNDPGSEANFGTYKAAVTGQVDGLYASVPGGVRILIGAATYKHSETKYRVANNGLNESGFEVMSRKSGGVRVSSHIPAVASKIQGALAARRRNTMHAVMPIWRGVTLIPDRITKAANGQVVLTAVALWSLKVLRVDGFGRLKFKVAA